MLAHHGYIGATPTSPVIAFSFQVLEAYWQLHRTSPRLAFEAYVKALCHLHHQFRMAFDAYQEILHRVDMRVDNALERDHSWRNNNVCPPCLYKVQDEPPLRFSLLAAMDGNNSLKLVDSTFRPGTQRRDNHTQRHSFWITPEEVDMFKDAVATGKGPAAERSNPSGAIGGVLQEGSESGEPTQGVEVCLERWRNAGPDTRKRVFALFAVSGIFIAVCRHGHVLFMCDMICSGELMKYPLSIVQKMFKHYSSDIALGYDIACAFSKSLERSPLAPDAQHHRLQGIVPAFHSYVHNRGCQVDWHPIYTEGVGLEDFEECERTFSKSNGLAAGTRLVTPFHRHQLIEEHFIFHSDDKYAGSGKFIYDNYRQAQEIIHTDGAKLATLSEQLKTGPDDYEQYLKSEREYLNSLKTEPETVTQAVDYMDILTRLQKAWDESEKAKQNYNNLDRLIIHAGATSKEIKNVQMRYRSTHIQWNSINEEALRFEEVNGIEERWTPESIEYQDALVLMSERKYCRALDNLEQLMVQRLFELTKLGMSGYKQHEKIGQALKNRSEAIKNALDEYNTYAEQLDPPRPPLSWAELVEAITVADFDLLRNARQDIRKLKWAQPANREAMNLYFRIKRAREEIERLNVEIRRLLSFMLDAHANFFRAIARNLIQNPTLAWELQQRWVYRQEINKGIVGKLLQASRLRSFTGTLQPGVRVGTTDACQGQEVPPPPWAEDLWQNDPPATGDQVEEGDIDSLIQYFENL
ncbi:hypothetical protein BD779DRAFT_1452217 [Infundibulicybe gibba]|nr:hypothetical protein BD779DRAFT_1452217 [Infundibulicybe gibba]